MARRTIRAPKDPIAVNPGDGGDSGGDPLATECWQRWRDGLKHLRLWRIEAAENYEFVAGRQWAEDDISTLKAQGRPVMAFNRMMATMAAVSGYEINGRQEVTYLPREPSNGPPLPEMQQGQQQPPMPPQGAMPPGMPPQAPPGSMPGAPPQMGTPQQPMPMAPPQPPPEDHSLDESGEADVDTKAAKYFRQESDAEDEESEQFRRMLVSGMGWIEHRMDYDVDPDGMMRVEVVDEFEMVYDPSAMRTNITDRQWDIRGKYWDKGKAKEKWPKHDFDTPTPAAYDLGMDLVGQEPIDRLAASFYKSPSDDDRDMERKGKVGILEYTWFEQRPFYTTVNPMTGKTEDIEPKVHDKLQDKLEAAGMPPAKSVKRTKRKFMRAFIHGRSVLEEGDAPCPEQFQYQCITGHRDRNKNTWFGLCTLMKDPQRWANKWLSQFLHQLNTNVKTGVWYEKGALENVGDVEKKVAKPGFMIGIESGYFDKVRKEEPAQIPNDAMNLMQFAISSIRDVTGANLELMGQQTNDQPGVVENARKQAAQNVLAPFFSAQRQYRKIAGRITLYFIREYLSDGRWIRIVGPANAKYVQLAKDRGNAQYDIIVDQSPSSPNQKEAVFGTLAPMIPELMKAGFPIPPEVLDYVPGLPATLADKWKQLIHHKSQQPPPPDPKTELAKAKLMQEGQESQNQDALDKQRLAFDQMKAKIDQLMEEREMRMREKELAFNQDKLASTERMHLGTLSADALGDHADRQHDHALASADRAHASAEAATDREHSSSEAKQDRTLTLKTKPKGKPNG